MIDGPTRGERVTYRPDFVVTRHDGSQFAIDVKGRYRLPERMRIKALLWRQRMPNTPLVLIDEKGVEIDLLPKRRVVRRGARRSD